MAVRDVRVNIYVHFKPEGKPPGRIKRVFFKVCEFFGVKKKPGPDQIRPCPEKLEPNPDFVNPRAGSVKKVVEPDERTAASVPGKRFERLGMWYSDEGETDRRDMPWRRGPFGLPDF